jgi:hypothetical protein
MKSFPGPKVFKVFGMELAAWEDFRQRKSLKSSHAAGSMPKTLKTFALHERLSRGRLPGKVFHGGQRKTSAWSWRAKVFF